VELLSERLALLCVVVLSVLHTIEVSLNILQHSVQVLLELVTGMIDGLRGIGLRVTRDLSERTHRARNGFLEVLVAGYFHGFACVVELVDERVYGRVNVPLPAAFLAVASVYMFDIARGK